MVARLASVPTTLAVGIGEAGLRTPTGEGLTPAEVSQGGGFRPSQLSSVTKLVTTSLGQGVPASASGGLHSTVISTQFQSECHSQKQGPSNTHRWELS